VINIQAERRNVEVFERDADANAGYLYTNTSKLSCKLATGRTLDLILETGELQGRKVLDIGCGDGYSTIQLSDRGGPTRMVAADAAVGAVQVAARNSGSRSIRFLAGEAHGLPFANDSFDLVLLQSVLHHDHDPQHMIQEAFRIAPRILIHEPNGNNPGLKVIEKTSKYHLEHNEKSYSPRQMKQWIQSAGASVVYQKIAGFVPMFCPDWMAKTMKFIEPVLERTPVLGPVGCAVCVLVGARDRCS
jgi:ubiquinone/menaquinone biosynthesis C-methylase UbiE